MALTLLQALNKSLKRDGTIAGSASELTSLTDASRQVSVDRHVQLWNEVTHELYSLGAIQGEVSEGTITLATDTNTYAMPSDFEQMSGRKYPEKVMVNTESISLFEYPGGYSALFAAQPDPSDFTGQPRFWAIDLTADQFRIDTQPTASENGDIYTFLYDKTITLDDATDTFPFTDTVVNSLVPAVAELANSNERPLILTTPSFLRAIGVATRSNPSVEYGFANNRRKC